MKDKYDKLRDKTQRIIKEAEKILKSGMPKDACHSDCASCLAATARGKVDEKDFDFGFDSSEDVCMLDARNTLAEKHNLTVY